jgi:hypothetical protein
MRGGVGESGQLIFAIHHILKECGPRSAEILAVQQRHAIRYQNQKEKKPAGQNDYSSQNAKGIGE